jgi:pentatricopeptide repeat protein
MEATTMRSLTWAWVVFGVVLGGSTFAQGLGPGAELSRQYREALPHYDKAVRAFSRNDHEAARRELDKAISAMPQYSYAHLLMAKSWYLSKRYDEALPAIERAETAWREFAGIAADAKSDHGEALIRRRRGLQDQINALQQDFRQAATQQQRVQIQNYITTLQQQIDEIDRDQASRGPTELAVLPAEYSFVHGNILLRMNRLIDAEPQYLRAIETNPKYGEAFNNLASLYFQAGRLEEARSVLQQARGRGLPINLDLERAVTAEH